MEQTSNFCDPLKRTWSPRPTCDPLKRTWSPRPTCDSLKRTWSPRPMCVGTLFNRGMPQHKKLDEMSASVSGRTRRRGMGIFWVLVLMMLPGVLASDKDQLIKKIVQLRKAPRNYYTSHEIARLEAELERLESSERSKPRTELQRLAESNKPGGNTNGGSRSTMSSRRKIRTNFTSYTKGDMVWLQPDDHQYKAIYLGKSRYPGCHRVKLLEPMGRWVKPGIFVCSADDLRDRRTNDVNPVLNQIPFVPFSTGDRVRVKNGRNRVCCTSWPKPEDDYINWILQQCDRIGTIVKWDEHHRNYLIKFQGSRYEWRAYKNHLEKV